MQRGERRSSRLIRNESRFAVLRALMRPGRATRQQLASATGLSNATVANIVNELLQVGVIHVDSVGSSIGRPFSRLAITADRVVLVGVDVAETYVQAIAYDLRLHELASAELQIEQDPSTPQVVVEHIARGVRCAVERAGTTMDDVGGVGVSLPGQVTPETGVSVFAPNWAWHDVPVLDLLHDALGADVPVHLDNPLKAVAVAELWLGDAAVDETVVVVNLGTGVGVGYLQSGRLVRGVSNNAGEWGHTMLAFEGRRCRCGRRGCIEAYVGVPGMIATAQELSPDAAAAPRSAQTAFVHDLHDRLAAGDAAAGDVLRRTADYLAAGLGDLVNLLNPDRIVLTGWMPAALGRWLLPAVQDALAGEALPASLSAVTLARLELAGNPVALGMGLFAMERFLAAVGVPSRAAHRTATG